MLTIFDKHFFQEKEDLFFLNDGNHISSVILMSLMHITVSFLVSVTFRSMLALS